MARYAILKKILCSIVGLAIFITNAAELQLRLPEHEPMQSAEQKVADHPHWFFPEYTIRLDFSKDKDLMNDGDWIEVRIFGRYIKVEGVAEYRDAIERFESSVQLALRNDKAVSELLNNCKGIWSDVCEVNEVSGNYRFLKWDSSKTRSYLEDWWSRKHSGDRGHSIGRTKDCYEGDHRGSYMRTTASCKYGVDGIRGYVWPHINTSF
jgi:hypothetical protein